MGARVRRGPGSRRPADPGRYQADGRGGRPGAGVRAAASPRLGGRWHPAADHWSEPYLQRLDAEDLEVVGRLAPGVTLEAAQDQCDALAAAMAAAHPARFTRAGKVVPLPLFRLQETMARLVRGGLYALLGAVGLLLGIAALNVANLCLSRGLERRHEMAIRRALGAGPGALVGPLLAESVLVATAGCAVGVAAAFLSLDVLLRLSPAELSVGRLITIDPPVLGVAFAIAFGTAVLFGLAPELSALDDRLDVRGTRNATDSTRASRLRSALFVTEVALSLLIVSRHSPDCWCGASWRRAATRPASIRSGSSRSTCVIQEHSPAPSSSPA